MRKFSTVMTGAAMALLLGVTACGPDEGAEKPISRDEGADRAAQLEAQKAAYEDALAEAEASRGAGEPALWTLSDEDTTLYIFGTVHLLRPDLDWRSDEMDSAFAEADTIVFEADVTSQAAASEMMKFISNEGMLEGGQQLSSLLSELERAELQKALDHVGLPLGAIEPFRPWWAAVNLSVLQIKKEGFDPNSGVETVLGAEARAAGKSFAYLETIDEQLGRLANMPTDVQVDFLVSSAESIEEGGDVLDTLVSEWVDGDVHGIGLLMSNPDMMGSDEVYEALLKSRNEVWVGKIEAMLDEPGTRLIAVGAGHLAGEDSVIEMLEAKGYEVEGP
ncbi:TraB/GumN family protein [Hyphomonas sp.]|uniref:TraB/GumN family protein n=1 Tax=Hyphomonas sp. TaxID=87 RepID=UPI0030024395